jgi:hypothetical protein
MSKRDDEFFFSEDGMIAALGKEMVEKIKKEDYEMYKRLRNSPCFMQSDVAEDAENSTISADDKD